MGLAARSLVYGIRARFVASARTALVLPAPDGYRPRDKAVLGHRSLWHEHTFAASSKLRVRCRRALYVWTVWLRVVGDGITPNTVADVTVRLRHYDATTCVENGELVIHVRTTGHYGPASAVYDPQQAATFEVARAGVRDARVDVVHARRSALREPSDQGPATWRAANCSTSPCNERRRSTGLIVGFEAVVSQWRRSISSVSGHLETMESCGFTSSLMSTTIARNGSPNAAVSAAGVF